MTDLNIQTEAIRMIGGPADVVLSDMAHSFTGNRTADVARVFVRYLNPFRSLIVLVLTFNLPEC